MIPLIISLLLGLAVAAIIIITLLSIKWLYNKISEKIKEKKEHEKVIFVDTEEIINDYVKEKVEKSEEISMEDLEKMCEEKPYYTAIYDEETGEIREQEAYKPDEVEEKAKKAMRDQQGIMVFD